LLLATVFARYGSTLKSPSALTCLLEACDLDAPFRSPAWTAGCQPPGQDHRFRTASSILSTNFAADPFGCLLPGPVSLAGIRSGSTSTARYLRLHSLILNLPRLATSPWGFWPLRINASCRFRFWKLTVTKSPISSRSPPVVLITNGSPFQARYLPFGSLFRKPLGTICMMNRRAKKRKRKVVWIQHFAQFISGLFSSRYRFMNVKNVCIKQERQCLFWN